METTHRFCVGAGETPVIIPSAVYFIGSYHWKTAELEAIKIGKANDPEGRLKAFQTGTPHTLKLMYSMLFTSEKLALEIEKHIQDRYAAFRIHGDWFEATEALLYQIETRFRFMEKHP